MSALFASADVARAALALGDLEVVCPICGVDCVLSLTSEDTAGGHRAWPIECMLARSRAVSRAIHRTAPGGSRLTDCVCQVHAMLGSIVTYAAASYAHLGFSAAATSIPSIYATWAAIADVMCWELYGRSACAFVWSGALAEDDSEIASPWRLHEMRDAAESLGMHSLRLINPLNAESLWMLAVPEEEACRSGAALYLRAIAEELPWDSCVQAASDVLCGLRRELRMHYGQWGEGMGIELWTDKAGRSESQSRYVWPHEADCCTSSIGGVLNALDAANRTYHMLVACNPLARSLGVSISLE